MAKKKVSMPVKEFVKEHKRLIHVLESPSHADDKVEAKKQSKELKEETSKAYPKSSKGIGCGEGLAGKICRHNVSRTNKMKKSQKEFIKDFKKSYDWKEVKTSIDTIDQVSAENASPELIQYLRSSLEGDLSKIPFSKGMLTVSKVADGLYSGFFSDEAGQVVYNYEGMTPEMIAKNMEVRGYYSAPQEPVKTHDEVEEAEDRVIARQEAREVTSDALVVHNELYHKGQEPGEPVSGNKSIKIKYGNFELEIKKSVNDFVKSHWLGKPSASDIKKAVGFWKRNHHPLAKSEVEAARELLDNWDSHKESFSQALFVIEQLKKSKNGR